jgi:2-polyprenyl-6-methoxyphenol hydroxylase-like FAD-dependent oxidoreductase
MRETGAVDGETVRHSIVPSAIPADLAETLQDQARQLWPDPWRSAVLLGLRAGRCFGTPIAEYVPTRLIAGHMALVGNAAHVSSPMTGSGFHYALLDVLSLRQAFAGVAGGEAVAPALAQFERARPGRRPRALRPTLEQGLSRKPLRRCRTHLCLDSSSRSKTVEDRRHRQHR